MHLVSIKVAFKAQTKRWRWQTTLRELLQAKLRAKDPDGHRRYGMSHLCTIHVNDHFRLLLPFWSRHGLLPRWYTPPPAPPPPGDSRFGQTLLAQRETRTQPCCGRCTSDAVDEHWSRLWMNVMQLRGIAPRLQSASSALCSRGCSHALPIRNERGRTDSGQGEGLGLSALDSHSGTHPCLPTHPRLKTDWDRGLPAGLY
jgi:hypothetical protein